MDPSPAPRATTAALAVIGMTEWSFAVFGFMNGGSPLNITLSLAFGAGGILAAAGTLLPAWRRNGAVIIGLAIILGVELVRFPSLLQVGSASVLVPAIVLKTGFLALLVAASAPPTRFNAAMLARAGAGALVAGYTGFLLLNVSLGAPSMFPIANGIDIVAGAVLLLGGDAISRGTAAATGPADETAGVAA